MLTKPIKHWLGRPSAGSKEVERWDGRRWIADDGKPGMAFSGRDERSFPIAWGSDCGCRIGVDSCPADKACRRTANRFGCSNGGVMARLHLNLVPKSRKRVRRASRVTL